MKIEISVFAICIIVFVFNTILDHLFNWWFREIEPSEDEKSPVIFLLLYIAKAALIISVLYQITK